MDTIQIAIEDRYYANRLGHFLEDDHTHAVHVVETPDAALGGVVLADDTTIEHLPIGIDPQSLIVLTKGSACVQTLWDAGVRWIVPAEYDPAIVRLVVLAAEMRLLKANDSIRAADNSGREVALRQIKDDELREQLRDLRNALATAVWNAPEVARAMDVLNRPGQEVQIEIDAVLVGGSDVETIAASTEADHDEMCLFDQSDKSFLQMLRISES
jgi:hypothetical protein